MVDEIENTDWMQDWTSEVHIEAATGEVVERREYLTYDATDLIAECRSWGLSGSVSWMVIIAWYYFLFL